MTLFTDENPKIEIHYHQLEELIPFMVINSKDPVYDKTALDPDKKVVTEMLSVEIEVKTNDEPTKHVVTTIEKAKDLLSKVTNIKSTDLGSIGYVLNRYNKYNVKISLETLFKILSENCKNIQVLNFESSEPNFRCDEGICDLIGVSKNIAKITIANINEENIDRLIQVLQDKPNLTKINLHFNEKTLKNENTNKFIRLYENHKENHNSNLEIFINSKEIDYNKKLLDEVPDVESIKKAFHKLSNTAPKSWMVKLAIFIVGVIATSFAAYYLFNRKASSNVVLPNLLLSETPVIPATFSSPSMESPLKLLAEAQLARRAVSSGNNINL